MSGVIDDLKRVGRSVVEPLDPLKTVTGFGTNPGDLTMRLFVPTGPARERPLVVVLHGCAQTAESYDLASGWTRLAAQHDFMVLYPEQQRRNNQQNCFSWFEAADTRRGAGEVESISQMVDFAVATAQADPERTFVCGLSAGGAMAGAMLASYPEMFRAGAIIAGLPYGSAMSSSEAYEAMSPGKVKDAKVWGDFVRAASPQRGNWPSVAVWHGTADSVVRPINAGEIIKQWTNVHGIGTEIPAEDNIGRVTRRVWTNDKKRACVTEYSIPGIGHGTPIEADDPPAPFFIPAGISSTWHIANDWGLTRRGKPTTIRSLLGF